MDAPSRRGLSPRTVLGALPRGTLAVGVGLVGLGLFSYGYLAVAARGLAPEDFARLSVVWTALFLLGPGLFAPLEQHLGRTLAVVGLGPEGRRALRRTACAAGAGVVVLAVAAFAALPVLQHRLLGPDLAVAVALVLACGMLAPVHTSRGVLAGTGHYGRYGAQLAVDGALRTAGAAVLLVAGSHDLTAYAAVLVVSQAVAVLATVVGLHGAAPGVRATDAAADPAAAPAARGADTWAALGSGLGVMVVGTLASQFVANASTVVVQSWAVPGDAAAGRFLTALVLARLPLFLFAALQASLLPRLAAAVAAGDLASVRRTSVHLTALLTAAGLAVTVVIAAAGPQIAGLLFGPGYAGQRLPLTVLSLGATAFMVAQAMAQVALAFHRSAAYTGGWLLGVAVFVAALAAPLGLSLPIRASLAFAVSSASVAVAMTVWFLARLRRPAPAASAA